MLRLILNSNFVATIGILLGDDAGMLFSEGELGAGIGLTGLAAAQVVGLVVLTDFQSAVLANLEYNAAHCFVHQTASSASFLKVKLLKPSNVRNDFRILC